MREREGHMRRRKERKKENGRMKRGKGKKTETRKEEKKEATITAPTSLGKTIFIISEWNENARKREGRHPTQTLASQFSTKKDFFSAAQENCF